MSTPRRMSTDATFPTRREFLAESLAAGGGLVLVAIAGKTPQVLAAGAPTGAGAAAFEPNAFVRIGSDDSVTIVAKHDEMGQGIHTGIAIVVCEELEIDVDRVNVVHAPADQAYGHSEWRLQLTGGSTSTWSSFEQMRTVGATAREMLIAAAASRFEVDASECIAENGTVRKRDGSASLTYGQLAADAARQPVPTEITLKKPSEFKKIGRSTRRVDSASKVRGQALFSLDRRFPGSLTAVVARCPYFGGRVRSYNARAARQVAGVRAVVEVPAGIAVVADGYWAATKGREALEIDWDPGAGGGMDSARLRQDYLAKSREKGMVAHAKGGVEVLIGRTERTVEATYEVPFQAHAPMEPLSTSVRLRKDGGADIITGSQMLGADQAAAAAKLGVDPSLVNIENAYLGGAFGRRANPASDFVVEAVDVALAARALDAPIQTVWSREDDLRGGWYRPYFVNAMSAAIQGQEILAWRHRVVGQSVADGTPFAPMMIQDGVDTLSIEGAAHLPYAVANEQTELHTTSLPIPIQWWRSVGHSNTAFAKESFLDECAETMGSDAYELRRTLLDKHPRLRRVLDLAAEKAGWNEPAPRGVGRGISVHESFKGFAAHVVEASVEDGKPKIHRIVCAIDCGPVVNPDQVEAQMQGAAIFALSATLGAQITFTDGRVDQSNFHDFEIPRMHEAPRIEVHIVDSQDPMGGIGEVGVPGIPSAVCTALFHASGRRIRRLPVGDQLA